MWGPHGKDLSGVEVVRQTRDCPKLGAWRGSAHRLQKLAIEPNAAHTGSRFMSTDIAPSGPVPGGIC
jgi:succinylglutamate desuccinylase